MLSIEKPVISRSMQKTSLLFVALLLSPMTFVAGVLAQTVEKTPSVEVLLKLDPAKKFTSVQSIPSVGLFFQGSDVLNQGKIVSFTETYTAPSVRKDGYCLGGSYYPPEYIYQSYSRTTIGQTSASFRSDKTPPARGLRVVIRNVTAAIDQSSIPYTDREYHQGDRSESFVLKRDVSHDSQYLAVVQGSNEFRYEIKNNLEVVESGTFTAIVSLENKVDTIKSSGPTSASQAGFNSNRCKVEKTPGVQFHPPKIKPMTMPDINFPEFKVTPEDYKRIETELNRK
jgi:hypothetical protein